MPRKTKSEKLNEVFDWLNKDFPIRRSSKLIIRNIDKNYQGYVSYDDVSVEVVIDQNAPFYVACETLIHEWAHVKSRRVGHGIKFIEWYYKIDQGFWKWKKSKP